MVKTLRIWDGCRVLGLVTVDSMGSISTTGPAGGAENGAVANVEIDLFAGLLSGSDTAGTPIAYREVQGS